MADNPLNVDDVRAPVTIFHERQCWCGYVASARSYDAVVAVAQDHLNVIHGGVIAVPR